MLYRMPELKHIEDSAFMKKLRRDSGAETDRLVLTVSSVAKEAAILLDTVGQHMPLYTLHNERHVLNVIRWMQRLSRG